MILELKAEERVKALPVLEESFSGMYLWHSKKTLFGCERVFALFENTIVGVIMLKRLSKRAGYVYYIATRPAFRRKGYASKLLEHSLQLFKDEGVEEVYASVREDNKPSLTLFESFGFKEIGFADLAKRYGKFEAFKLYSEMMVVPGEKLLVLRLTQGCSPR
ncbi:hypothetical protein B9Q11_02045 [Candidatus Marsarchaeota G2 archaeon ECH_B_SAG-F08]|uniref:N-acetyltransferase domain-containing protein n=7 Tax=Candidatus Marsarchaeota TaxID=1978152 RepID=A0A2R6AIW0_9ARCH|nr:MAG: hypothetical protein B9Q01_07390 [Candidatus Marsarchaeota G1 archaeon OSP_D]PSN86263.1 MAG: hypothetical protein B9Q02_02920 [Candidatus Marsarchaeota G1 archaeon BE_D]PSN90012.1 MAG: hypothetical protein B9P99_05135 [Candidatus Marsarchaeota G1 archaeon OSP_B]PSN98608.1 MAG: hypothetical protein B9Q11_02045 [Candidatus Marsarchaeota G2 archaeon ECH_B_SAG-F08]PSO02360.1 MAG: hypothetical protein B9Q10_01465 [Candidatus Marsarchaeota G2 archaeon ECH_B_SAG-E12]PSO05012.1 MAG: hypothetic